MFPWTLFNPYFLQADLNKVKLECFAIQYPESINFEKFQIQGQFCPENIKQQQIDHRESIKVGSIPSIKHEDSLVISKKQLEEMQFQMHMKNFLRPEQKKIRKQNKARNFYSTLIRSFLRDFHEVENVYYPVIERILKQSKYGPSYKKFKTYLYQKQKKLKNYIRHGVIQNLFDDRQTQNPQKKILCKLMRILMKHYLQNHFFLSSTYRKNLQDENYLLYLHTKRKFLKIYCCGIPDQEE